TLTVLQPCTLQPLPTSLAFSATQGQTTSTSQAFTLSSTGSCGGGVAWTVTGDANSASWLSVSPTSGTDTGGGTTITVAVQAGTLTPGMYTGQISVFASNNGAGLVNSPQTISVLFTVTGATVNGTILACSDPSHHC